MLSAATSDGGFINILDHSLKGNSERYIRYAASLILHLAFGHRVNSTDDKYVQISETAVTGLVEGGNPSSQVVDLFPAREFSSLSSFCSQVEI
jgi:hypothetical protein